MFSLKKHGNSYIYLFIYFVNLNFDLKLDFFSRLEKFANQNEKKNVDFFRQVIASYRISSHSSTTPNIIGFFYFLRFLQFYNSRKQNEVGF